MTPPRTSMPNLPPNQRLVQRLVDEFNLDQATWREAQRRKSATHLLDLFKRLRNRCGKLPST